MNKLQTLNQTIGYAIGKRVSTRAGLKQRVSRLLEHLSVLPKDTQQRGDKYGPPNTRNNKSYPVRARG